MLARDTVKSNGRIDSSRPRPVVLGAEMKVSQIAREVVQMAMTPEEVATAHPHLTLADVHAALTYYYDHQDAIHQDWAASESSIADLEHRRSG